MRFLRVAAVPLLLISPIVLTAKDKKKSLLPDDVLQAKTVLVVVQPGAGIEIDAPNANRTALDDVENALTNWGRFRLVRSEYDADLVISVRKGTGRWHNRLSAECQLTTGQSLSSPPLTPVFTRRQERRSAAVRTRIRNLRQDPLRTCSRCIAANARMRRITLQYGGSAERMPCGRLEYQPWMPSAS
jgi:hypothetical protein